MNTSADHVSNEAIAVDVKEASKMISCSVAHLYNLFSAGALKKRKVGNRTLVLVEDLKRLVEAA